MISFLIPFFYIIKYCKDERAIESSISFNNFKNLFRRQARKFTAKPVRRPKHRQRERALHRMIQKIPQKVNLERFNLVRGRKSFLLPLKYDPRVRGRPADVASSHLRRNRCLHLAIRNVCGSHRFVYCRIPPRNFLRGFYSNVHRQHQQPHPRQNAHFLIHIFQVRGKIHQQKNCLLMAMELKV